MACSWSYHSESWGLCDSESELESRSGLSGHYRDQEVPQALASSLVEPVSVAVVGPVRRRHVWRGRLSETPSNTSQQVSFISNSQFDRLIPCGHHMSYALVVQWYEQPCCVHEIMGSNLEAMQCFHF